MNTMKNLPSGDQGLVFQTHALQMILFGPFTCDPKLLQFVTNRVLTVGIFIIEKKNMIFCRISICKDTIRNEPNSVGFAREKAQTMSFVERGFERLGLGHQMVSFS